MRERAYHYDIFENIKQQIDSISYAQCYSREWIDMKIPTASIIESLCNAMKCELES